jgi:parallel beta-helix repeat protein
MWKRYICFLVVSALAFGLFSAVGSAKDFNALPVCSPQPAPTPMYNTHSPIRINGDGDLSIGYNGVVRGSGTQIDPYIIEGWEINCSSHSGYDIYNAIYIGNTTAHFVVQNCHLETAAFKSYPYFGGTGISFYRVFNGTIRNNTMSQNKYCVYLDSSNNNIISNNYIFNNDYGGIYLGSSSNNVILSNQIYSNNGGGIEMGTASNINNTISDNNLYFNNKDGIYLHASSQIEITNNTISSNNGYGISLHQTSKSIISSNLIYLNQGSGILVQDSNINNISNNTISNNKVGIYLQLSKSNEIIYNNITHNTEYGINTTSNSDFNHIYKNNFIGNNGGMNKQAYDNVGTNFWNTSGSPHGFGNYWSDWASPDNNTDGIVDFPYYIAGGTGTRDYFPIAWTPPPPPVPESPPPALALVLIIILPIVVAVRRRGEKC